MYPSHGRRVFPLLTTVLRCVKISDKTIMAGCCRNRKDSSAGGIRMDEHQSGVKLEEALEAKKELDAKAQKILEEKEADSRMRTYTGPLGRAVAVLLCVWTAFQLYFTTIGAISAVNLRAIHCIFLLVLHFYYFRRLKRKHGKESFRLFGTWRLSFVPQAVSFISF